jgi:hypothetical protein
MGNNQALAVVAGDLEFNGIVDSGKNTVYRSLI